jgi:hypothetical protein
MVLACGDDQSENQQNDFGDCVAEGEGFEPPVRFPVQRFSRPPVSTTHTSLRGDPCIADPCIGDPGIVGAGNRPFECRLPQHIAVTLHSARLPAHLAPRTPPSHRTPHRAPRTASAVSDNRQTIGGVIPLEPLDDAMDWDALVEGAGRQLRVERIACVMQRDQVPELIEAWRAR